VAHREQSARLGARVFSHKPLLQNKNIT
jgi:hypothetical protein